MSKHFNTPEKSLQGKDNELQRAGHLTTVHFKDGEDMNNWQQDQQTEKIPALEDYDQYRVTKEKDIPQPEPTITIAGAAVASPGNITGISAAAKAGNDLSAIIRDMKKFTSKKLIEQIKSEPESRREWMLDRFAEAGKDFY